MIKNIPLVLLGIVLAISLASASVTCTGVKDINFTKNTNTQQELVIQCINSFNSPLVTLSKGGSGSLYFSLSETIIGQSSNSTETQKSFTLSFEETAPQGDYISLISFSDGSPPVSFLLEVLPEQQSNPTGCNLNPSLVSYTQTFQQGTQTELPKIFFNPTNCQGDFSITSAFVTGGVTTTSGQKPVYLKSASSSEIILGVDTKDLSSLTYNTKLTVTAFSKTFTDVSTITIIVTGGTNPQGAFNINNLPTCSLSNTNLNTNLTYSLICSNLVPDIFIEPIFDSNYIIGKNGEKTATQFIWEFTPKKFGETTISANFKYNGFPVGEPFTSKVKISATSGQSFGTSLRFLFTPNLDIAKNGEVISIQLVDDSSGNLVESPDIEVNAIPVINISSTGKTFFYSFEINKNYSLRGTANGYGDLVQVISLSSRPINILISPETGNTNTLFNITNDANATMFINNENKGTSYYGILPSGNIEIKSFKEGYQDTIINITITSLTNFLTDPEFKKNSVKVINLDKNTTWNLYYQKTLTDTKELILTGEGNKVEFTPKKIGNYVLETGDGSNAVYIISGTNWKAKWWFMSWYWWIGIVLVIGFFLIYKNNTKDVSMSGDVNYA